MINRMNFFKIVIIGLILIPSLVLAQPDKKVLNEVTNRELNQSLSTLIDFLKIPNDANFPSHVSETMKWVKTSFESRGFQVTILPTEGKPLLVAESKIKGKNTPTVMFYAHADGQPVDSSKWFQDSPYQPVYKKWENGKWEIFERKASNELPNDEWRIFARSASDDKSPIVMFLTAYDISVKEKFKRNYHIKFVVDFEEEQSSLGLRSSVSKYASELAADQLIILDGPRHISNLPTLTFGARGIATMQLKVYGPRLPQHSGHYGNYAPNPALRLSQLLAGMKDDQGRVTIPGYYDGIQLDDDVKAILNAIPDDETEIRKKLGVGGADQIAETYQQALQYPSLNIRGLSSGWVESESRTIVPSEAIAELDLRLVVESDGNRMVELVRNYIESKGYYIVSDEPTEAERLAHDRIIRVQSDVSYAAFRTSFNTPIDLWLTGAMQRAFGAVPIKERTGGGSVPISPFVKELHIPAVIVPTVNRDNNQHSPNENIRIGNYREGIVTILAILTEKL